MVKIEILLSTYNGDLYINELLESIYKQDIDAKLRLLIRDDGSKDNTIEIIYQWSKKIDIKLIRGKNLGPKQSFFELIREADMDYDFYAFCDQDDVWKKNKLSDAVKKIGNIQNVLYFSNAELVDKKLKYLGKNRFDMVPNTSIQGLFVENPALGCTMIIDKLLISKLKRINSNYFFMHDVAAIILAASIGNIIYDENSEILYRQHENSVTQGHKFWKNIFNKINFWFFQKNISIALQAENLIELFKDEMNKDVLEELRKVEQYKKGVNRIFLVKDKRYRVCSVSSNRSFILRVLLGVA